MSKKTVAQLEEKVFQLEADLGSANDELDSIKNKFQSSVDQVRAKLEAQSDANEVIREGELAEAREGYDALFEKAGLAVETQRALKPELIGVAANCAREGIISTLEGIFGDL